jgi:hypothetical protein
MVSRRRSHGAGLALVLIHEQQFVAGAAFLEAAGELQVIQLAVDVAVAQAAQLQRIGAWAVVNRAADAIAGGADRIKRNR